MAIRLAAALVLASACADGQRPVDSPSPVRPAGSSARAAASTAGPEPVTRPDTDAPPGGSASAPITSVLLELRSLLVAGRGPRTGYRRDQFGPAWADTDRNGCDTRNDILRRDLTVVVLRPGTAGCVVLAGVLADPYTGQRLPFRKADASAVQIDHVVALSDAWQKGAAGWPPTNRLAFANDPLNLLAVDGPTNASKGDSDAASWLPTNKPFRCAYVSRLVAVKARYGLRVTPAERHAMTRVLSGCPG